MLDTTNNSAFKEWMLKQFEHNELADLYNHGAVNGFSGLIWYSETVALYDQYHDDIWDLLEDERDSLGYQHCLALIASFNGANNVGSDEQLRNLLVWYAAEHIAFEITQGEYIDEDDGLDDTD